MGLYDHRDYKAVLKCRIKRERERCPAFTLGKMAESLDLEASYLSRVLNSDRHHFSEDQLFRILSKLGFRPAEKEYALLLRSFQTTTLPERKTELEWQIAIRQKTQRYGDLRKIQADLDEIVNAIRVIFPG